MSVKGENVDEKNQLDEVLTKLVIYAPKGYVIADRMPYFYRKESVLKLGAAVMCPVSGYAYDHVPRDGVFYALRVIADWPEIPDKTLGVSGDNKIFNMATWHYSISEILSDKNHQARPWLILACKQRAWELTNYLTHTTRESGRQLLTQWTKFENGEDWRSTVASPVPDCKKG